MSSKVVIFCKTCGSTNVQRDAYAEWDTEAQKWELGHVFDQGYCSFCDGEASLGEAPLAPDSFECHVTTQVAYANLIDFLPEGWETSEIKRDPALGDKSYFYLTRHHVNEDELQDLMQDMVRELYQRRIPVLRAKIKHITYDVRYPQED